MTPTKLLVAVIGTALVIATAATSANAETYQRQGQGYNYQQPSGQPFGDRRFTNHWPNYGNFAPRAAIYMVPAMELRRYVARNGRYSLHGPRFKRWVVSHGRPMRFYSAGYRRNGVGFDWYRPRQPRWAYVNINTGRIWF